MSFHGIPKSLSLVLAAIVGTCLPSRGQETGTADHVIYLHMSGGMSRYETFDPKEKARTDQPDAPLSIPSTIPGCEISATLPRTAALLKHCLLLRTLEGAGTHVDDHASYFRRTGYRYRVTVEYPEIGAWIAASTPDGTFFRLNDDREAGGAFFEARGVAPVVIPSPALLSRINNDTDQWKRRADLFRESQKATATGPSRSEIVAGILAREKVQDALDRKGWPKDELKPYGNNDFGVSCFLARRLVGIAEATFVEVTLPGWDISGGDGYFTRMEAQCRILDEALSALILDLEKKELLSTTLVVLASDYDRSPALRNGSRGPFSQRSVALLCGGGIEGGKVIGETNPLGYPVNRNQVTALSLNSIIARALRMDPLRQEFTPSGRPASIGDRRQQSIENLFVAP